MRKMIFAAVAAVALGTSSVAMAAHGGGGGGTWVAALAAVISRRPCGGGLGHIGGGFGAGHLGGGQFGGVHPGGGLGLTPHVAGLPSGGGVAGVAPHTFSGVHSNPSGGRALASVTTVTVTFAIAASGWAVSTPTDRLAATRRTGLLPDYNNCDPEYYDQSYN